LHLDFVTHLATLIESGLMCNAALAKTINLTITIVS